MANHVKLKTLHEHFQCGICQGYIIDATTILDCLHSFCKSCIFHFIESIDHRCPTCNQSLGDIENCIRYDSSLQRLIYQIIPNLLENELERRMIFQRDEPRSNTILHNNSLVNVKLYHVQKEKTQVKLNNNNSIENKAEESFKENYNHTNDDTNLDQGVTTVKYIQCMAQTPIRIISRMIRNKYNIPQNYRIKLSHMGHNISDRENLLILFTSFIKSQTETFEIKYEFVKRKQNRLQKADENLKIITDKNKTNNHTSLPILKKNENSISSKCDEANKTETLNSNKKGDKIKTKSPKKNSEEEKTFKSDLVNNVIGAPTELLETETVYYSDQDYDDSNEGKLLIDDKISDRSSSSNGKNDSIKKGVHADTPLDLRL